MKKIRTGLIIAALTAAIGTTTSFAQQGAGATSDTGTVARNDDRPSMAPLLGLLGLLGLMGLKRRNERYADDRR